MNPRKISQHTLFFPGKSLIEIPDQSKFLHVSFDDRGQLVLHILENPTTPRFFRKIYAQYSSDRLLIDNSRYFIAATTHPGNRNTALLFIGSKRYNQSGHEITLADVAQDIQFLPPQPISTFPL
jgi:hypothetical protein